MLDFAVVVPFTTTCRVRPKRDEGLRLARLLRYGMVHLAYNREHPRNVLAASREHAQKGRGFALYLPSMF